MNADVQELLDVVRASGVTLTVDGPDLVIRPGGVLPAEVRERVRAHKPELLAVLRDAEFAASRDRLQAANITVAVLDTGDIQICVTDADRQDAQRQGYTLYSPVEMYLFVAMPEPLRRQVHQLKQKFGGAVSR
jgi:hypothetical protein